MNHSVNLIQRPERRLILQGLASATVFALGGCVANLNGSSGSSADRDSDEAEVTPGEDLMQEHGVLERVLLIYGEAVRRVEHSEGLDFALVVQAAGIIRGFVEDYHERNEEQFVFRRLEVAKREVALVTTLRAQHQRGREVTDEIVRKAKAGGATELSQLLRSFERMYRPHAAREDTVLFPAFRSLMGRDGYVEIGEQFEDQEHARFGAHGFEDTVGEVARIEAALGIDDLSKFTAP